MSYPTLKMNDDLVLYFPDEALKSLSAKDMKAYVEFILNQNKFNCVGPGEVPRGAALEIMEKELAYVEFYKGDFLSVDVVDKHRVAIRRLSNHPSDKRKKMCIVVDYRHLHDTIDELLRPVIEILNEDLSSGNTDPAEFLIRYVMGRLYRKTTGLWPNHAAVLNDYLERSYSARNEQSRLYRLVVELEDLFWFDIDPSRLTVYIHEPKTKSVTLYFNVNGVLS